MSQKLFLSLAILRVTTKSSDERIFREVSFVILKLISTRKEILCITEISQYSEFLRRRSSPVGFCFRCSTTVFNRLKEIP